jgi:hypothetical protein
MTLSTAHLETPHRIVDVVGRHLLRFTQDEKLTREWATA